VLDEAQELGSALLTKPFSPTKLVARIARLLGDSPPPSPPPRSLDESR
jgi:DNA-binding response OmpR family regulator